MSTAETLADLYLRLSDLRNEEALDGREAKLRAEAGRLGWTVHRVVVENDLNGGGKPKPASAYKRVKITIDGEEKWRVDRPEFRSVIADLMARRATALLAEDLDRLARDPRDLEDLIDCAERKGAVIRSLSSGEIHLETGDGRAMARVVCAFSRKESEDKGRRVADARERLAGQSYGGGRRPYGYRPDPDAPKYHKKLILVGAEAAIIRQAAADILDRGISLKAVAAGLRESGTPTVTGAPWSAETLKDVLLKDAVTGLTDDQGRVVWPAIIERDTQDRLRDLLAADSREVTGRDGKTYRVARNTSAAGNAPRWLVSLIAECGVCGGLVKCTGSATRRAYTCRDHGHVRRDAAKVDALVSVAVVDRLSLPAEADLMKPPPRPGTDAVKLRSEAKKLRDRKAAQMRMHAVGDIDDADLAAGMRVIRDRLAAVDSQLAASDAPDPLAEFRDAPADAVWDSLPLARRRAVVRLLVSVTILPVTRKGRGFDENRVRIEWNLEDTPGAHHGTVV